jgi:hypothetical protein
MFLVELLAQFVIKYFKHNYIAMYANYLAHFLVALAIALGKNVANSTMHGIYLHA